ncbi:hypothetical protein MBLNU230_g5879t1 [Neophaeotheca triangularis]
METHIRLAQSLPPRLLNFFKRYPPPQLAARTSASTTTASQPPPEIAIASNTSSSDPNAPQTTTATAPSTTATSALPSNPTKKHNPFLPFRNPTTGNWHSAPISLRRQAELFKLAQLHHVLPLMPESPKHPETKEQKRVQNGLRVQGTGLGRKVKGKMWERTLKGRLEARKTAMEGMPEMIRLWKERGHGRGWKKWPK